MSNQQGPPIIIIKKKVNHGGHHGGAWKVAYADFVTAMMALFIVLWLLNSSKQIKEAVGGYFKDPSGKSKLVGNGQTGAGDNFTLTHDNMDKLKEELQKSVRKLDAFEKFKNQIEMTITSEGLRIELMESKEGTFFPSGVQEPNESGKEILGKLAEELGKLPNKLSLEGHTDATPYASKGNYSNWELSADRANAARRLMQMHGIGADQITQIRGYADQRLRKPENPHDSSNRRISVIVQYRDKPDEEPVTPEGGKEGEPAKEGEHKDAGHGEAGGKAPAAGQAAAAHGTPTPAAPAQHGTQPATTAAPVPKH
jgi:chemotaxis protein MotB